MLRNQKSSKRITPLIIILIVVFLSASVILLLRSLQSSKNVCNYDYTYDGEIAIEINDNKPEFTKDEIKRAEKKEFEEYSKLDKLGRCGTAVATICKDTMPGENDSRTSLGSIYPTGWQSINFWSRCHLIGWQLAGENDNERNLITGTSRMNLSGMLPQENKIASYIEDNPDNHVLYKVEPIYDGDNLVASGVHMQSRSVEDNGEGLSFNYYIFNYQPGYIIDYSNGMVENDPSHQTIITLEDKTAQYTGNPVIIGEASVKGSTGDIKYIYFTDSDTSEKTSIFDGAESNGYPPSEKGVYYVKAVVSGDNWYPSAASETAKLTIK